MKGRKIKCLSFSVMFTLLLIVLSCFPISAAEYGEQYPAYLKQSGGCFIECQTNLGKGSLVFARTYQFDYIGFYGGNTNLMNLQANSISGQFVLQNGMTYDVRATGFSTFEYYNTGDWGRYYDLTISQIYNTNVQLTDDQSNRGNFIYDFGNFELAVLALLVLLVALTCAFGIRSWIKNV